MRILLSCMAVSVTAGPQGIIFGGSTSDKKDISNRNNGNYGNGNNGNNGNFQNGNSGSGGNHCCCVPEGDSCLENYTQNGGDDLVGQGFIDERIVNRPPGSGNSGSQTQTCPYRNKICCYPDAYDFSVFGRTCVAPSGGSTGNNGNGNYGNGNNGNGNYQNGNNGNGNIQNGNNGNGNYQNGNNGNGNYQNGNNGNGNYQNGNNGNGNYQNGNSAAWRQGCSETSVYGSNQNQCGRRNYDRPVYGLKYGEASPGEFPWTCLLLNNNNDFIGTCAVIPEGFNNDNSGGTRKIITAAHNLNKVGFNEVIKVRVGEYDASGYNNPPELQKHEEYSVSRIIKHPQFDPKRLSNDIAILRVNQRINLNHQYVNTACLPSCDNQFDYQFSNGTGVRCWVAGWGKGEFDGSFQFIQHKVDVPIVDDYKCNAALKRALNRKQNGVGDRFQLHESEVCAGTETGKDACTGDGGSPLVCQAQSGRWTVVGLVSWGIGCATDIPGVYTKISHFKNWINAN